MGRSWGVLSLGGFSGLWGEFLTGCLAHIGPGRAVEGAKDCDRPIPNGVYK